MMGGHGFFDWLFALLFGRRGGDPVRETQAPRDEPLETPAQLPDAAPLPMPEAPSLPPLDEAPVQSFPPIEDARVWREGWNPAVPMERRHAGKSSVRREGPRINRVVIHITGKDDMEAVRRAFVDGAASAHYVVEKNGALHQFVSETRAAWHAGVQASVAALYNRGDGSWRKYLRYFDWYRGYPADAIYVDAQDRPVAKNRAILVKRADGGEWPDFAYFDSQWGREPYPVGYTEVRSSNARSIGIEVLSVGHRSPGGAHYTEAMYQTLVPLVRDICERHGLERNRGNVCGHEDVNPVERWGWDPHRGFDWARVLAD